MKEIEAKEDERIKLMLGSGVWKGIVEHCLAIRQLPSRIKRRRKKGEKKKSGKLSWKPSVGRLSSCTLSSGAAPTDINSICRHCVALDVLLCSSSSGS